MITTLTFFLVLAIFLTFPVLTYVDRKVQRIKRDAEWRKCVEQSLKSPQNYLYPDGLDCMGLPPVKPNKRRF